MRVAFIGDVHGDVAALAWALSATKDVPRRICLGDVVDGPPSGDVECVAMLQRAGLEVLQGNHDHWAAESHFVSNPQSESVRRWLAGLPRQVADGDWMAWHTRFQVVGNEVHWDYLTDEPAVRRVFESEAASVILCGHTHVPAVYRLRHGVIQVIPGRQLQVAPTVHLDEGDRVLVHIGRPTQCVVVYGDRKLSFTFRPTPRFERRFSHLLG
ncbi:MAG TPA: metallophosphoesterase family protein [Candidatus Xenobia bacterium]|jgi:predicted phosphodiesterase